MATVCIASVTLAGFAQAAGPAAAKPAPESVLKHIPTGTMGFVVLNNLQGSVDNVEKFLKDIGLEQLVKPQMPQGMMAMLKGALGLGEGFNEKGGVAAVMLDPQQFGIDLIQLMAPGAKPPEDLQVPFVLLVPGSGVAKVFPKSEPKAAGDYTQVTMPFGPVFGTEIGGYVMLSPNTKALAAVAKATKRAADEFDKTHAQIISQADIALHVNMKVTGPVLQKVMQQFEEQMKKMQAAMAEGGADMPQMAVGPQMAFANVLPMYREMISQLGSITIAGRFAKTGVVIEMAADFKPDSAMGKMLGAYKPTGSMLVDRLPNLPYVVAGGYSYAGQAMDKQALDYMTKMFEMLGQATGGKFDDATRQKLTQLTSDWTEQLTEVQFVGGGAPEGSGLFGAAVVAKCKDAAKFKGLLQETTKVGLSAFKSLIDDKDIQQLEISYAKAVDKTGAISVDAIEITHPELARMDEDEKEEMKQVLGEARIRVLVAAPDNNTVVMTFGGAKAFLGEAIKAVQSGGNIAKDTGFAEAMKHMPKNRIMLAVFNGGNLFQVIAKGVKQMGGEMPPFQFTTKTPLALGAGIVGTTEHVVVYVPTGLVKEVAAIVTMFLTPGPGPGPKPPVGGEDF